MTSSLTSMSADAMMAWWQNEGKATLDLVGDAERRFSAVVDGNLGDVAGLAACDGLTAATQAASASLSAHPCPDDEAERLIVGVLDAYGQIAELMSVVVSDPTADEDAAFDKVKALHAEIVKNSERLPDRIDELLAGD